MTDEHFPNLPVQPYTPHGALVHITLPMVIALLTSIIERVGPDTIGTKTGAAGSGCSYTNRSGEGYRLVPSCIIGYLFHDLGVLAVLSHPSKGDQFGPVDSTVWGHIAQFVTADQAAKDLMSEVQLKQDLATPWGKAFEQALVKVAREYGHEPNARDFLLSL